MPELDLPPYLADRGEVARATALIAEFGGDAGNEAAERADRSRAVGNHLHYCRWRQVERLVDLFAAGRAVGTVH
ncbi:MAG: hypothetical protein V4659_05770 [Pseudomonadota bacterium]